MPEALLHKNKPLAVAIAIILAVLLHIGNFFQPLPEPISVGPLYQFLHASTWPPFVQTILAIAVLIISGLLLDLIVSRFNFLGSISGYPVLFFAVFASLHPIMGTFSPGLAALPFIILGIWALMINFGQSHGQFSAFANGLCFSIPSLIYPPFVVLIPFGITALAVLKPAKWREFSAQILGFGMPYGLFYAILYLSDAPIEPWIKPGYDNLVAFFGGFNSSWGFWLAAAFCFALLNLALLNIFNTYNTYKIITRRFFTIVILIPAFLIPAAAWPQIPDADVWWPVIIPFSVLVGRLFLDIKKISLARLIFIVFILVALLARFDYYFGSAFTFKLVN